MEYVILSVIVVAVTYVIFKAYKYVTYFENFGIPQPQEIPFLGALAVNTFGKHHVSVLMKKLYNLDKNAKYVGCHMFNRKYIIVRDLDLIKSVLIKNFDHFTNRIVDMDETNDPLLSKSLTALNDDKWREVRNILSPSFTSSKLRTMFQLMSHCAENFSKLFVERYRDKSEINMNDVFSRFANDIVASCAYGIEVDSLEMPNNDFYVTGKRCTNFTSISKVKLFIRMVFPRLSKLIGIRFISKEDTGYFVNVIRTAVETREKQGITRPDMLQLMMEARNKASDLDSLDMAAHAFIFFIAGFDTATNQMSLLAHLLAEHQDVQNKLQIEIDGILEKTNGKPTYEAVNSLSYLDAVFNETMRLHPVATLHRTSSKDFELPAALSGAKPYVIKKGDTLMVPISGIHDDPDYFENPSAFDPERFVDKKLATSGLVNLGFGMGPRMCIGNRFVTLEIKILFTHLLAKCSLKLCDRSSVPLEYLKFSNVPSAKNGFWLKIEPRL